MTQGKIRTTSNTKLGRQVSQAKGAVLNCFLPVTNTSEQDQWNKRVEMRRNGKKLAKFHAQQGKARQV